MGQADTEASSRRRRPQNASVRTRGGLAASLVVFVGVAAGCANDDRPPGTCDTRLPACQQQIADEVSRARGGPLVTLPPIEVLTEAELRARLESEVEEVSPEQARAEQKWAQGLILLRLIASPDALSSGTIDDFVQNVGGYYDPETGVITLIDRGGAANFDNATSLFAHELAHHAQAVDQNAGFGTWPDPTTFDDTYALAHHSEGEAVVVAALVMVSMQGTRWRPEDAREYFAGWLASARRRMVESADPFLASSRVRYPVGGAYLSDAWFDGGNANLRAQWAPAVLETASWMRGYGERAPAEALDNCELPRSPSGYLDIENHRMGGELLFPMLVPDGVRDEALLVHAWETASTWRGDHLRVYVDASVPPDSAAVAVAYRVRADSVASAREIEALLFEAQVAEARISRVDRDVLLLLAEDPSVWATWSYPGCTAERTAATATPMPAPSRLRDLRPTWLAPGAARNELIGGT